MPFVLITFESLLKITVMPGKVLQGQGQAYQWQYQKGLLIFKRDTKRGVTEVKSRSCKSVEPIFLFSVWNPPPGWNRISNLELQRWEHDIRGICPTSRSHCAGRTGSVSPVPAWQMFTESVWSVEVAGRNSESEFVLIYSELSSLYLSYLLL